MPTVHQQTRCAAPRADVFNYIANYRNVPQWLYGIKEFEPNNGIERGLGAEYAAAMSLGATIHSTIQVGLPRVWLTPDL